MEQQITNLTSCSYRTKLLVQDNYHILKDMQLLEIYQPISINLSLILLCVQDKPSRPHAAINVHLTFQEFLKYLCNKISYHCLVIHTSEANQHISLSQRLSHCGFQIFLFLAYYGWQLNGFNFESNETQLFGCYGQ